MIVDPLNDAACLGQLTAIANEGSQNAEIKALAARFRTTSALAEWIRGLPQRDDAGAPDDGPRIMCDVGQRARLVAPDPNCVERAILYLAAAEVIDPAPVRQLATVDISETLRHTYPVEEGEPVVLDPQVRRNALRAHVWHARNGGGTGPDDGGAIEIEPLIGWLLDLAEDAADEESGAPGVRRVERARGAMARLLDGEPIHARDRAHVLYALQLAGEVAPWFGEAGSEGYRVARRVVARVTTRQTVAARALRNVSPERVVYWGGKALATYFGVGGLYDSAYAEVRRRPGTPEARKPAPAQPIVTTSPSSAPVAAPPSSATARAAPEPENEASPPMVVGTLEELDRKERSAKG